MERVAFLKEDSGERLSCLLNPESIVVRRRAGVRPRESSGGLVTGSNRADNSLLFTGGGCTTLELALVFDVSLAGSSVVSEDVRDMTGLLWELAENTRQKSGCKQPALCCFVWGKTWKISGVITAVAERLESFTAKGVPRRSWLRLRMMRVMEKIDAAMLHPTSHSGGWSSSPALGERATTEQAVVHEVISGGTSEYAIGERADQLAFRTTGDARNWRAIAEKYGIDNPLALPAGLVVESPSRLDLEEAQ